MLIKQVKTAGSHDCFQITVGKNKDAIYSKRTMNEGVVFGLVQDTSTSNSTI